MTLTIFLLIGFTVRESIFREIIIESEHSSMSSIFELGLGSDANYLENEIEVLNLEQQRTISS